MISSELRKLASLPSTFVALAISLAGTLGFAVLSANSLRSKLDAGNPTRTSTMDAGFDLIPIGVIGVVVLGVAIISSEYTAGNSDTGGGRQITTSLTGTPARGLLLTAKAIVLTLVSGTLAVVTITSTVLLSQALLGEHGHSPGELADALGPRAAGAVLYWVLTALIAFAITVLTRSGIIPLIVLIANTAVVSVTFLLTKVTSLAMYLPDVAGAQMFAVDYPAAQKLDPLSGGTVMGLWTLVMLGVAGFVFTRRDA